MYKTKSLALVALAILFGGLFVSGAAQTRLPQTRLPQTRSPQQPVVEVSLPVLELPLPVVGLSGIYKINVNASEMSKGDMEFVTGSTHGWTWYGSTEGDLSGHMFVSMNYSSPFLAPEGEISEIPGGVSTVTGGSWSKLIFIKGQYAGSVHGKIVGGQVIWNGRDPNAAVSLQLTSDEGTGDFEGSVGSGTFEGIFDQSGKRPTVSGSLILNY